MQLILFVLFFNLLLNPIITFVHGRLKREAVYDKNTEDHTLFQVKKDPVTEEMPDLDGHDAYQHLEKHIHSLKKLSRSTKDQRTEIIGINNLFACLESDSPYSDCSKIGSFK